MKSGIIRGMGKRDNALIMILDIDKVFTYDELAIARDMTGAAAE